MAHLEKQAKDIKDREDLVPFTGEKRGMVILCSMLGASHEGMCWVGAQQQKACVWPVLIKLLFWHYWGGESALCCLAPARQEFPVLADLGTTWYVVKCWTEIVPLCSLLSSLCRICIRFWKEIIFCPLLSLLALFSCELLMLSFMFHHCLSHSILTLWASHHRETPQLWLCPAVPI